MSALTKLVTNVADRLQAKHWQLVTAESCTGGMVASYLTDIPGSSNWFERGFVTYSNLSKQEMLGVNPQLIAEFGAVSEQVAASMAEGALAHSSAQIALSITGIAGPGGGTLEKPVGTVCFAWAVKDQPTLTLKRLFSGSRHDIRLAAVQQVLEGLLQQL